MRIIKYLVEGLVFILIVIVLFNMLAQFLQILGIFSQDQISYVGMISVLLAVDNILTKSLFCYRVFQ